MHLNSRRHKEKPRLRSFPGKVCHPHGTSLTALPVWYFLLQKYHPPFAEIPVLFIGVRIPGMHFIHDDIDIRFDVDDLSVCKNAPLHIQIAQMSAL